MGHESEGSAPRESTDESEARPPLDDYIAAHKRERDEHLAKRDALAGQAEREVLAGQVDAVAQTIDLVRHHGIPGELVDVFTASDQDLVGTRVLNVVYDRLGITGARVDAPKEALFDDHGDSIGAEYHVLAGDDLVITELHVDDPTRAGYAYHTLKVGRPRG